MSRNIIVPIVIIIFGSLALGGIFLGKQLNKSSEEGQRNVAGTNLRQLELSVPGMFCAGCTASVENYVAAEPGVERVQARLTPSKSATVVYNPTVTSPQAIIGNEIFQVYGVEIIEDKDFQAGADAKPSFLPEVPQEIQAKSQKVVTLLRNKESQGQDTGAARSLLQQVNRSIEAEQWANASALLDSLITQLSTVGE